jgi:Lar family restriction alleviation protein
MTTELMKPCPFCKHDEIIVLDDCWDSEYWYRCECLGCEALGPMTHVSEEDAIALWNQRADAIEQEGNER